jgi:hypothetical protein
LRRYFPIFSTLHSFTFWNISVTIFIIISFFNVGITLPTCCWISKLVRSLLVLKLISCSFYLSYKGATYIFLKPSSFDYLEVSTPFHINFWITQTPFGFGFEGKLTNGIYPIWCGQACYEGFLLWSSYLVFSKDKF